MNLKLSILFLTLFAGVSFAGTQTWSNFEDFSKGYFENVMLTNSGQLEVGYPLTTLDLDLPAAVTATAVGHHGDIYVATSGPGQVWQIQTGQKAKLIYETRQPMIAQLVMMPNEDLAILVGPQGGVYFIRPSSPNISHKVAVPEQPLSAYLNRNTLYVVGNSNKLYTIEDYSLKATPIIETEQQFRSVHKNYYGSGQTGTVYRRDKAIFKGAGETVGFAEDRKGNLYAAFNTSPTSSQIWKISDKETSCLIWESSKQLVFSMVLQDSKLFWGTGPNGQLFSSSPNCKAKPDILLSLKDRSRIVSLIPEGKKLLVTTAKSGGVFELDLSQKATSGRFIGPVVKLDAPSRITETSGPVWLGNTPIPDNSWSNYEKDKNRQAQFVEPRVIVMQGKPLQKVSFSYAPAPEIPL